MFSKFLNKEETKTYKLKYREPTLSQVLENEIIDKIGGEGSFFEYLGVTFYVLRITKHPKIESDMGYDMHPFGSVLTEFLDAKGLFNTKRFRISDFINIVGSSGEGLKAPDEFYSRGCYAKTGDHKC